MADYLIVGLGNPGKKYVNTRHNVGFQMIDTLASYFDVAIKKVKCRSLIGECRISGKSVILAKPQTFMNLSGEAVLELVNYYKIPNENVIVIYDDISLDVGRLRIREKGSAGGHNGIKNIIYMLETDVFPRVKIGVGTPDIPLIDYVLHDFSKADVKILTEIAVTMPKIVEEIMNVSPQSAMNKYNM